MIWKFAWSTQGNECSGTKDSSDYLPPASDEKERLGDGVQRVQHRKDNGGGRSRVKARFSSILKSYRLLSQVNLTPIPWAQLPALSTGGNESWVRDAKTLALRPLVGACFPVHQSLYLYCIQVIELGPQRGLCFVLCHPQEKGEGKKCPNVGWAKQ